MIISILKWFGLLLKAIIFKKGKYILSFERIGDRWYVVFPNWPLSHDNLEMVAGADDMLNLLSNGESIVKLEIVINSKPSTVGYYALYKTYSSLTGGAHYIADKVGGWDTSAIKKQLWLCPVTLTVLGHYPNRILFKKLG